jgi:hypothetical protein
MKKIVLVSALAVLSSTAFAHPNTGCGLGSMLLEKQSSLIEQLFAGTTNGTGSQTSAITSGTSGCRSTSLVFNEKVDTFVANNMDALATDIANGHGEFVDTLASMMQVDDKVAFAEKLQANFAVIYSSENISSANVIHHIVAVAG